MAGRVRVVAVMAVVGVGVVAPGELVHRERLVQPEMAEILQFKAQPKATVQMVGVLEAESLIEETVAMPNMVVVVVAREMLPVLVEPGEALCLQEVVVEVEKQVVLVEMEAPGVPILPEAEEQELILVTVHPELLETSEPVMVAEQEALVLVLPAVMEVFLAGEEVQLEVALLGAQAAQEAEAKSEYGRMGDKIKTKQYKNLFTLKMSKTIPKTTISLTKLCNIWCKALCKIRCMRICNIKCMGYVKFDA